MKPIACVLASLLAVSCLDEGRPGEIAVYTAPEGGAPFAVRLDVTGNHAACGKCDAVSAVVTGGIAPYSYQWSDPSLIGPGPHVVCPEESARVAVAVTDSRRQSSLVSTLLECSPGADGGTGPGGLNGCAVLKEVEKIQCDGPEYAGLSASATKIEVGLVPGKQYEYTYNQTFPIGIGNPSTVDVYLGMNPCEREQLAFTLQLDSMVSQSHCFTPARAYRYSTAVIHVNGIPFTLGVTPIVCDTCTK